MFTNAKADLEALVEARDVKMRQERAKLRTEKEELEKEKGDDLEDRMKEVGSLPIVRVSPSLN